MSKNRYTYQKGDRHYTVAVTKRYAARKQEMDKLLEDVITPLISGKKLSILDAGCGIGHLSSLLSKISPESEFLGVDQTKFIIDEAKDFYKNEKQLRFEVGDIEELPEKYGKAFDITVCRAVLSWVPYYKEMMKALFGVTRKHIFVSSLFYEGDIDFITQVREFKLEAGREGFSAYQNVYSLPHFKEFLYELGAKNVEVFDFKIGIDLPRGDIDYMGTYTVKTEDGHRLQISGAILMKWKWIRIDL